MARKKISITEYNTLHQDVRDAKTDLVEAEARFVEVQKCEVVDNCKRCKGIGKIEDGTGDPTHNPTRDMRYVDCPQCEGKGYV